MGRLIRRRVGDAWQDPCPLPADEAPGTSQRDPGGLSGHGVDPLTSTPSPLTRNRGSRATSTSSGASGPSSGGTRRPWWCGPTTQRTASAATWPPSPARRASTKWASTTSSKARPTAKPVTKSSSKATPPPGSTPEPSWRAASAKASSAISAGSWPARTQAPAVSAPTPTPGSCPSSGSSPRCPWAWGRSTPSTRRTSTATCTTGASRTPPGRGCGASWATASATNPRPSAR